jgi:outer membrane protein OmpA-like peptidoglycan-associated protein
VQINIGTPPQVVLRDRRGSDDLEEVELRRRIEVFRDAQRDRRFELSDREFYGETVRRDREVLRRRMLDDRQRRRIVLTDEPTEDIEIELNDAEVVVPARRKRDVFAAEVDDAELEEVLIAPPTRKIRRRLTVDQATFEPEIRNSIPRIEVDTVRFGFNEAFVREEEVGNLDRVAEVIEKILRKYPREVFLIEGHTDAVGSDAYNQKLSKARAEAIKKALTIYYVIPAKNLKTVGLGERYLKIPTAEAEGENRRVSISRATALVGEVD